MYSRISLIDDPALALLEAGKFLREEPILHNLILSLLHERIEHPVPSRYWIAKKNKIVVGLAIQSPLHFSVNLALMDSFTTQQITDVIAASGLPIPGISGEAKTAAAFAGRWLEHRISGAFPSKGLRLYENVQVRQTLAVNGYLRQAIPSDRELLIKWVHNFNEETGNDNANVDSIVERRLAAGQFWLWEDEKPVSLAVHSKPVEGVLRIQLAYTPSECRNQGYAQTCVAELTRRFLLQKLCCILYTDLGNLVSNTIFLKIGYRAVAECLHYEFG